MIPKYIIIHCSASFWLSMNGLWKWHVEENGWSNIGYHYIILNGFLSSKSLYNYNYDGFLCKGREETHRGAHTVGYNKQSIGICLAGGAANRHDPRFTFAQFNKLINFIPSLQKKYQIPINRVIGHYEADNRKPYCPGFDMNSFRRLLKKETEHE